MDKSSAYNNASYNPFSFLKLDNKLNVKKIQQKKKQQRDKNVLSVYQKKLPNIQLINQCNKIMELYKDHYNGNRRFSVFYEKDDQKKNILNQEEANSNNAKQLPSILLERSQSTHNFTAHKKSSSNKNTMLTNAQRIMKPIRTNQYINQKGFIKLNQKSKSSSIKNTSTLQSIDNKFVSSALLRNSSYKSILSLTKDQNMQENQHLPSPKRMLSRNTSSMVRQKRRKLKAKFRKNIFLIIEKMKLMKVTFSQIIEKNIFDNTTPYKFGDQIFHAVKEGYEPKVFRIMMQNRLSIFSIDTTGKTTLMWACMRGFTQVVQLLLSNGVQPHGRDINGKTALYFSIKYNHVKCAKMMFLYSHYLQHGIQSFQMSQQMRKMVRIGLSTHKYLTKFKSIDKKKEYFEQEYRYYFKQ